MGFYGHYTGQSIGRIMNFIEEICGLRWAEECTFGSSDGWIRYHGKPFARVVSWEGKDNDIPFFEFTGENADWMAKTQNSLRLDKERWDMLCYASREVSYE